MVPREELELCAPVSEELSLSSSNFLGHVITNVFVNVKIRRIAGLVVRLCLLYTATRRV